MPEITYSTAMPALNMRTRYYQDFATLCGLLGDYVFTPNTDTENAILRRVRMMDIMPLPSGRWGDALGVALEMHYYEGALLLLSNKEALGLHLDATAQELMGSKTWNVMDTFILSLLSFDYNDVDILIGDVLPGNFNLRCFRQREAVMRIYEILKGKYSSLDEEMVEPLIAKIREYQEMVKQR